MQIRPIVCEMRKQSLLVKYGPMVVGLSCLVATCLLAGGFGGYGSRKVVLIDESLFIVPQANVLTGAGQRPVGFDSPHAASTHSTTSGPAQTKKTAPVAAKHSAPAKGKAATAPKHVKKAAPKWSTAQKAVEEAVVAQMAKERAAREARFQASAVRDYAASRAAALQHEKHRQQRFKGQIQRAQLQDEWEDTKMKLSVSNKRSRFVA